MDKLTEAVYRTLDFLRSRKKAYQLTFNKRDGSAVFVLRDLAVFCKATVTTEVPGDRDKALILEGRRQVWLRIQNHLNLTSEELFALYSGKQLPGDTQ